jgi:ubiquinone biosynthesis protein UbiJ
MSERELMAAGSVVIYEHPMDRADRIMRGVREALQDTPGEGAPHLDEAVRKLAEAWRMEQERAETAGMRVAAFQADEARLMRGVEALKAEVDRLRWEAQGSPMKGE